MINTLITLIYTATLLLPIKGIDTFFDTKPNSPKTLQLSIDSNYTGLNDRALRLPGIKMKDLHTIRNTAALTNLQGKVDAAPTSLFKFNLLNRMQKHAGKI